MAGRLGARVVTGMGDPGESHKGAKWRTPRELDGVLEHSFLGVGWFSPLLTGTHIILKNLLIS